MADYLRIRRNESTSSLDRQLTTSTSDPAATSTISTLTVSLLSLSTQPIAEALSKPQSDHSSIFASNGWDEQDPPGLRESVGTLKCEVVSSRLLRDVCPGDGESKMLEGVSGPLVHGSELFICRVLGVNKGEEGGAGQPLLHWRQQYISIKGNE